MKRKHIILLVVLVLVVVGAYIGVTAIKSKVADIEKQMAGITISAVALSDLADGTYSGSYAVFPVAAEVKVTVRDHTITAIELVKHNHGQGKAAEAIPDSVVKAQTLDIDVVSGATYSSKVILKAIENALTGGKE